MNDDRFYEKLVNQRMGKSRLYICSSAGKAEQQTASSGLFSRLSFLFCEY